jgi:hypothetical protein
LLRSEGAVNSTRGMGRSRGRRKDARVEELAEKENGDAEQPDRDYVIPMFTQKLAKLAHESV